MPGGSRAGYDRWHNFKLVGLNKYSSKRNAFLQRNGVSRLSAYHHWGMISPWRIAREAMMSGAGPTLYQASDILRGGGGGLCSSG